MTDQSNAKDEQSVKPATARTWGEAIRKRIPHILVFILILGSIFHEQEANLSSLQGANAKFGAAVRHYSTFSFLDEIYTRVNSCTYSFLVICQPKEPDCLRKIELPGAKPICLAFATSEFSGVSGALELIPRLPDAWIYVLSQRWQRGPLEFSIAVLYFLGVVSIVVAAVRENILYLPVAAIGGPIAMSAVFWVVQFILSMFSAGIGWLVAFALSLAANGLLLNYLSLGHDLHGLSEAGSKIIKGED